MSDKVPAARIVPVMRDNVLCVVRYGIRVMRQSVRQHGVTGA